MSRGGFGLLSGTWRHFTEIFVLLWELFFFSQYLISLSLSFFLFLFLFLGLSRCIRIEPSTSFLPQPFFATCHQRSHLSSIPQQFCRALSTFSLTHLWCSSRGLGSPNGAIFVAINAVFLSTGKDQRSAESSMVIHSYQCLIFFDGKFI